MTNANVRTTMTVSLPDAIYPGHRGVAEVAPFRLVTRVSVVLYS
jgi:hypothetical protein